MEGRRARQAGGVGRRAQPLRAVAPPVGSDPTPERARRGTEGRRDATGKAPESRRAATSGGAGSPARDTVAASPRASRASTASGRPLGLLPRRMQQLRQLRARPKPVRLRARLRRRSGGRDRQPLGDDAGLAPSATSTRCSSGASAARTESAVRRAVSAPASCASSWARRTWPSSARSATHPNATNVQETSANRRVAGRGTAPILPQARSADCQPPVSGGGGMCRCSWSFGSAQGWPLRSLRELVEAGVAAQRVEVGVDAQPAGREVVRDLQQRLQQIERPVVVSRGGCGSARAGAATYRLEEAASRSANARRPCSPSRTASALRPR